MIEIVEDHAETKLLFGDLDKPSLHALSYSLRHPDTWPKGFFWNYNNCNHCAMGLAHALWREVVPPAWAPAVGASVMARTFAMPFGAAKSIFLGDLSWIPPKEVVTGHLWWKRHSICSDHASVTPEMVADQIDAYLAKAE